MTKAKHTALPWGINKLNPQQRREVNALIELAQDDLEGVIFSLVAARAELLAQRDELLAALKLLMSDVQDYEAWQRPCHAVDVARAALARAEKGGAK